MSQTNLIRYVCSAHDANFIISTPYCKHVVKPKAGFPCLQVVVEWKLGYYFHPYFLISCDIYLNEMVSRTRKMVGLSVSYYLSAQGTSTQFAVRELCL